MDRHRLVQQYVERQRSYVPTYANADNWSQPPGTPLRCDGFGFDTPVLRPRVLANKAPQSLLARPSKSRTQETEPDSPQNRDTSAQAPLQTRGLSDRDKPRTKRNKASTPVDTDNERTARLADRRERKRKKRDIVNPPQKHGGATADPNKGRRNDPKTKKPSALALMYGFSATNVTKDRLTLKPPLSLGVFSKGKASAKKKVAATKKSSSKNDIFSESVFLNKQSEQAADYSKVDGGSDDCSISSISKDSASQVVRATSRAKNGGRCAETPALKTPQVSTRTTAESEVWDIELQSKLPSSAHDVSSEPGTNDSAPVTLDLRKAEWCTPLEEHKARSNRTRSRCLSVTGSPLLARSDLRDELGVRHAEDEAPSIHPSHSASQAGRCEAGTQPSDSRNVITSKYFAEPKPLSALQFAAEIPHPSRSNDSLDVLDFRVPDQDVQDAAMDMQTILRVTSPINSLISAVHPMVDFGTRSDVVPLEFPSDCSPYDDCYVPVDVPPESLGGRGLGCFESGVVEPQGAGCHDPRQGCGWRLYRSQWCSSDDLLGDDVECGFFQGCDPLVPGYKDELEEPVSVVELTEYDPGEAQPYEPWSCVGDTHGDFAEYEEGDNKSNVWDGELGDGVAEFLEGRALLLGVSERPRYIGLSGLAQAEMDVASRLRDHWRPLRLS